MENQITFKPLSISDLAKEGKTLASIWSKTNNVKKSIADNGFDVRLGRVMAQLRAESPNEKGIVGRDQKARAGISTIDRRRLNEALQVFDNLDELREFNKSSKKGFTNLTALLKAWKDSKKTVTVSDDTEVSTETQTSQETKAKSNVGQNIDTSQISLGNTKESLLQALKLWSQVNNQSLCDIADWTLELATGTDPVDQFQEMLVKTDQGTKKVQVKDITNEECPF